jgi:hypothetical protein
MRNQLEASRRFRIPHTDRSAILRHNQQKQTYEDRSSAATMAALDFAADANNNQQKQTETEAAPRRQWYMAVPDFTNTGLYTLLENRVIRFYFETTLPLKLRDATLHRQSMPPEWVVNRLFVA